MNVIDAQLIIKFKGVVALSTEKVSSPVNSYGASKQTSDEMFVAGNHYAGGVGARL